MLRLGESKGKVDDLFENQNGENWVIRHLNNRNPELLVEELQGIKQPVSVIGSYHAEGKHWLVVYIFGVTRIKKIKQ